MTYSAYSKLGTLKVYVETTPVIGADGWRRYDGNGGPVQWVETAGLELTGFGRGSGMAPSMATFQILGPADSGPLHTESVFVAGTGLDANGAVDGAIVEPELVSMMDQVKITYTPDGSEDETVVFIGLVTKIVPSYADEVATVEVSDFRWLTQGAPLVGWRVYHPVLDTAGLLADFLPIFNPRGKPNRANAETHELEICTEGHATASDFWTRGHVWNGLHYHYDTESEEKINFLGHAIDWDVLADGGHGDALFDADNVFMDLAIGGMNADKAVETLLKKRGGHDVWLKPNATGERATLTVYGTAPGTIEAAQTRVSFKRGAETDPLTAIGSAEPDVDGGSPAWDASRVRLQIVGLGAKKKYDLTFDTVIGTLARGWSAGQLVAWLALSPAERKKQYKNVLRRFVLSDELDWAAAYGWPLNVLRERLLGGQLLSTDAAAVDATGQPVRLRAQVWISQDAGATWSELPANLGGVSPVQGGSGVELSEAARDKGYTWDGNEGTPGIYDVRITVSVEADERLSVAASAVTGSNWPRRQALLLDDHYVYQARREAYMNASAGVPVLDGGAVPANPFGDGADDVIEDDGVELAAQMGNLIDQLGRLGREGPIVLAGFRPELEPGNVLEDVTGGGTRPDESFDCVIRRVAFSFGDKPQTTIYVEAD